MEEVLKGDRFGRITHTIVSVGNVDFSSRSYQVESEYHLHVSNHKPVSGGDASPSPSVGSGKALGVAFTLPDGTVKLDSVQLNGVDVPAVSPMDDLVNVGNFALSYWAFPAAANTEAMGEIYARLCAHRRDLISYEEISKAHHVASANQSFGLLLKLPPQTKIDTQGVVVRVKATVTNSPLFKQLSFDNPGSMFASLGGEVWFPIPSRLMLLPSGAPVTSQPIEHQRHRVSVSVGVDEEMTVVATGDRQSRKFDSSWVNPRSVGIFIGQPGVFASTTETGVCRCVAPSSLATDLTTTVPSGLISEIVQVLAPWFSSPVQLLPQINIVFLPLPVTKDFFVLGNTVVVDSGILHRAGMVERQILARSVLAEALATLWVERAMPAFADVWLPVGIAAMLADRFAEFHFGTNEYLHRLHARRHRFHSLVERGLDWRPLTGVSDSRDPVLRLKAPLVMETLRRSVLGESDLRTAFHELATIASGKKGPWTSENFFYLLTCTVGQHTEAGQALPEFKENWVRSVGVPVIHVGFSMLEKRRFVLSVSQRPLQRINLHDNVPMCALPAGQRAHHVCGCGQDFVCRKEETETGNTGATYMRPHFVWTPTVRRRFWPGDFEVSIYRAQCYYAPVTVRMDDSLPDSAAVVLTVPYVTPRKHELVLSRNARDDELVHGWISVLDDRWLLAKVVICQSSLMWCNKLQFSRSVPMELSAIEALQHVRGSAIVQELLLATASNSSGEIFWRVRQEASRGIVHLALGSGEREAMQGLIQWMSTTFASESTDWSKMDPKQVLTWIGASEHIAHSRRSMDRRDCKSASVLFSETVKSVERSIALHPNPAVWKTDPHAVLAAAVKFALLTAQPSQSGGVAAMLATVDSWVKSDSYGAPLASPDLVVTDAVLSAAPSVGSLVVSKWPFFCDLRHIEGLAKHANRRLARTAVRAYLSIVGGSPDCPPESEGAWVVRLIWIEKLTEFLLHSQRTGSCPLTQWGWLVDSWELVVERYRRDSSKSPLHVVVQHKGTCDKLWIYLTKWTPLLPPCMRSQIQHLVHGMYIQAYGTGVPGPYRELIDKPRPTGEGPMSFWLPFKEHEKAYRRCLLRGCTVRPEQPKHHQPKKPRLVITGSGTIPLPAGT